MRILIVGAGGVGGNLAARLAATCGGGEHEVILLARESHALAIQRTGLVLRHPAGTTTGHPAVVTTLAGVRGVELAIVAVKDFDLEAMLPELGSALAPGAWLLPLLNGLPRAAGLRRALPDARVFEACIYVASTRVAPGEIEQQSPFCRIVLQAACENGSGDEDALCALLARGGVSASASPAIATDIWTKFLFVCPMAGVTSLYGMTFGEVLDDPDARALLVASMEEIATLAEHCGAALAPDAVERALATAASFPAGAKTSMQRDVEAGRPTELDALAGSVVRLGATHDVPVPANATVYQALRSRTPGHPITN